MRNLVLLASSCVWSGCASPGEPLGERAVAITNGMRAEGDLAVVALSRTRTAPSCTGTLIAPRIVLTAGHCISGPPPSVYFGAAPAEGGGVWIDGVLAERHPLFRGGAQSINDLALILLAEPAPVEPVLLSTVPLDASFAGTALRVVGFGSTDATAGLHGIKHTGTARGLDYDATSFRFTGDPSQTCIGDSGGPAFASIDGRELLVGVASSGDIGCVQFGRSTRVDYAGDFIEAFRARVADASAGPGERCYYPEQCASGTCTSATDDPRVRYCATRCDSDVGCQGDLICANDGLCRHLPPSPGAFGGTCARDADCADRVCSRVSSEAPGRCSLRCDTDEPMGCPGSYTCQQDFGHTDRDACFMADSSGCSVGRSSGLLLWVVVVWFGLGRRRQPVHGAVKLTNTTS